MKTIEEIYATLTSQEPFFQDRIQIATERAKRIVENDLTSEQCIIDRMKFLISSHFNIPFHSVFFDDLSCDDLILEVMLIAESKKEVDQRSSDVIKENKEEAEDAFGDLMDDDTDGEEINLEVPEEFSEEEKEFLRTQGKAFKESGFAGIKKQG